MIFNWICIRIKSILLFFVHIFRRALCCFRKRRNSYSEPIQLTQVISNIDGQNETQNWTEWSDESFKDKPVTVQDYIDQYREQKAKVAIESTEETAEEQTNFFEDMAPQIIKQTKVLVRSDADISKRSSSSRLNAVEDNVNVIPSGELGVWDENSGWEGEQLLDHEAQKVLREQKRLEREKRAWEQHQKRLEKSRTLGSKLTS